MVIIEPLVLPLVAQPSARLEAEETEPPLANLLPEKLLSGLLGINTFGFGFCVVCFGAEPGGV